MDKARVTCHKVPIEFKLIYITNKLAVSNQVYIISETTMKDATLSH